MSSDRSFSLSHLLLSFFHTFHSFSLCPRDPLLTRFPLLTLIRSFSLAFFLPLMEERRRKRETSECESETVRNEGKNTGQNGEGKGEGEEKRG